PSSAATRITLPRVFLRVLARVSRFAQSRFKPLDPRLEFLRHAQSPFRPWLCLHQEDAENAAARARHRAMNSEGHSMRRKSVATARVFAEWRTDPAYLAAYDALDEEFSLAESLISARSEAALTQDQLAK